MCHLIYNAKFGQNGDLKERNYLNGTFVMPNLM